MPTGYTAKLMDEGESFPAFVMSCARAFGALVTMRDDPSDTPIPETFEPSDYHAKAIQEAREKHARLRTMQEDQRVSYANSLRTAAISSATGYHLKGAEENKRLEAMEAQVRAWEPPTDDHKGLRDFMLEQIKISKNDLSYSINRVTEVQDKTLESYFIEDLSGALRSIAYHEKEQAKEVERAKGRTDWVRQLRASLPQS